MVFCAMILSTFSQIDIPRHTQLQLSVDRASRILGRYINKVHLLIYGKSVCKQALSSILELNFQSDYSIKEKRFQSEKYGGEFQFLQNPVWSSMNDVLQKMTERNIFMLFQINFTSYKYGQILSNLYLTENTEVIFEFV